MSNSIKQLAFLGLGIVMFCSLNTASQSIEECSNLIKACAESGCRKLQNQTGIDQCQSQCKFGSAYRNACESGCRAMIKHEKQACTGACMAPEGTPPDNNLKCDE